MFNISGLKDGKTCFSFSVKSPIKLETLINSSYLEDGEGKTKSFSQKTFGFVMEILATSKISIGSNVQIRS